MKSLRRSFYMRPTLKVARDLLGKRIIRITNNRMLTGRIVEVEAYLHNDPASHSFRKMTKRNEVMFNKGGYFYVYFTYGMHFCANVVTGKEGSGEAVLIRAVEPISGIEIMSRNRSKKNKRPDAKSPDIYNLTNGPAKFCEAFGITGRENGIDLIDGKIFITKGGRVPGRSVVRSPRIGISTGLEKKWRFYIKDNIWVSKS